MTAIPEKPFSTFDNAYAEDTAPWVIGEPQPAILALERAGWIRGKTLDAGCGTGEHTIHLAGLGYDVEGIDSSPRAVEQAKNNAAAHSVDARFAVADAFDLGHGTTYDTVLDSALFHIFDDDDRTRYMESLRRATVSGSFVHVLALADTGPGFGPQVSETVIREAFDDGGTLEELRPAQYRGRVVRPEHAALLDRPIGDFVDLPAWLARIRRD